jgi:Ca2+-binding EF-hand superfamily protein
MRGSVALLLVLCAASLRAEDGVPDLSFPGKERPFRVRMEATTDGPAAWDDFIDRLFAYFDRDGDGFLNRAETARMFALPLSAGKTLPFDFARMDAEGKVSRAKFKAYCRREGFGPVFVTVGPASDEAFRLGEALFRHLDGDQDGVLTRAELEHAPALLRRLDEDDDEVLTPAEVLAVVPGDPLPTAAGTPKILAAGEGKADVVLRLNLGAEPRVLLDGESLRRLPGGRARLTVPNHVCQIELIATMP